ncbi:MAG: hypothetical protein LBH44_03910 [Treponema sp.]|jgi:hypothetical protein|nr:hypothetical protein [Treponema sp.]
MHLNKTTNAKSVTPKPSLENAPAAKAGKPSAKPPAPIVPRSVTAMIAAAGLPADKLSASIISFARFFSLPLKHELMTAIRRQAFASAAQIDSVKTQATAVETADSSGSVSAKLREALSLAAAAAESKGVELQPEALELFAEAVDPDLHKRQNRDKRRRNKDNDEHETVPLTASGIRELALEAAENEPLLAILNRLPCKNGQRWIVLPFDLCENGRRFRVSLRILLEGQTSNGLMVLDITEIGENKQRWLFALDTRNKAARLAVYLQPEQQPKILAAFSKELSRIMEIPLERISVKNLTESFPCESGCEDNPLFAINETV